MPKQHSDCGREKRLDIQKSVIYTKLYKLYTLLIVYRYPQMDETTK